MVQEPLTVFPFSMDKSPAPNDADFRPVPVPADAPDEEESDPKGSSAQEPAGTSESTTVTEPKPSATTVQHPAGKANTLAKAPSPGKPASS